MARLSMYTPAEDTPMPSTRGIFSAALQHGIANAIEMVGRIGLRLGMPDDLLGIHALAVDHGGHLYGREPPASKPMRQPSRWRPTGLADSWLSGASSTFSMY